LAKEQIRKDDFSVLVEGNLDVIASHQVGVTNTVATAGTAMTRDHLIQLSRLSRNVKLAFDQDRAGLDATLRSIPIASGLDINVSIVDMGDAKDPDELIKQDARLWTKALDESTYVMDWLVEYMTERFDITTAPGKKSYSDALVEVLKGLSDPVETEHYIRAVAKKIGVGAPTIARKVAEAKAKPIPNRTRKTPAEGEAPATAFTYVDTFLGLLLAYPDTRDALNKLALVELERPEQQQVLKTLLGNRKATLADLSEYENYVKIIMFRAEEFYGGSSSSARLADAMETARRIAQETKKKQTAELAAQLRLAADVADVNQHEELLKQAHQRLKEE
jgi:DNA primase